VYLRAAQLTDGQEMSMSLTHPTPALRGVSESRSDRLRLLHRELESIRMRSDRSDPLDETVLCLAEATAHAATAAARLQALPLDRAEITAELSNMLGAARAAVVCATYAMADPSIHDPDRSQAMDHMTAPAASQQTSRVSGAAQVQRFYEYVDADNVAALVELFTEDCEYHRPGYPPRSGRTELATFYQEERVIRSGSHSLTALIVDGSHVAAHGRFDGELHSGVTISIGFADFFEMAGDGLFSRRHTYYFAPLV
jgi:steroid Delta-isomerase